MQEADEQLRCSVCWCQYIDPRFLPCLHAFCLECLRRVVASRTSPAAAAGNVVLHCPLCRNAFQLSPGGVDDLPPKIIKKTSVHVIDEEMGAKLRQHLDSTAKTFGNVERKLADLNAAKAILYAQTRNVENEIRENADKIKKQVDARVAELVSHLKTKENEFEGEIVQQQKSFQKMMSSMDSFKSKVQGILEGGTTWSDVKSRDDEINSLHATAEGLDNMAAEICRQTGSGSPLYDVTFRSTNIEADRSLVGELHVSATSLGNDCYTITMPGFTNAN